MGISHATLRLGAVVAALTAASGLSWGTPNGMNSKPDCSDSVLVKVCHSITNVSRVPVSFSTESRICSVVSATKGTWRWNCSNTLATSGDVRRAGSPSAIVSSTVSRKLSPVLDANGSV